MHVSNFFLDLKSVVYRAAEEFGLPSVWIESEEKEPIVCASDWVLLSRDSEFLNFPVVRARRRTEDASARRVRLWTDDYSNLFQVLKRE